MRSPARRTVTIVVLLTLGACAGSATSGTARPNANRITRSEIDEAGPSSAYDLVQKLRPIWLRKRGNTSFTQETDVQVYLDGVHMGGREALREISSTEIMTLDYLDARRATARFGEGHVAGAILIKTPGG